MLRLKRLLARLKSALVVTIDGKLDYCEFECKHNCSVGDYLRCEAFKVVRRPPRPAETRAG